jgi:hypothetical protein
MANYVLVMLMPNTVNSQELSMHSFFHTWTIRSVYAVVSLTSCLFTEQKQFY